MTQNAPSVASSDLSQRFALDTQGFASMKAAAAKSSDQGVKMAAQQFDASFMQMMLKSMRDATPADGELDSNNSATFTSMLDQQLAQQLSSKGVGMANAMIGQLSRNMGQSAAAGATGANGATGTAATVGSLGAAGGLAARANAGLNALSSTGSLSGAPDASSDSLSGSNAGDSVAALAYARAMSGARLRGQALGTDPDSTAALRGTSRSDHANAFVSKLASSAQTASAATGIPARFIVGQAALESGWGKHEIKNSDGSSSHNVFGIKAGRDWTGATVTASTVEYHNGVAQRVTARFKAYGSYDEAMNDYANTLKANPRYQPVIEASNDVNGFAQGMQRAGYATDPQYAKKLINIMNQMA
jgi:flagellar protein FlgJ